jgi:opacity protein-like surface antigen
LLSSKGSEIVKKIVLVAATLASVNVAALQADMGNMYVGGRMHVIGYDPDVPDPVDIDNGFGFGIVAGLPFTLNEQLSMRAEVGYVHLGTGEAEETDESSKTELEVSGYSLYGAAILSFHATDKISLFGKAGLSKTHIDAEDTDIDYDWNEVDVTSFDDSDIGITYGLGGEIAVNSQLSLIGEYTYFGEVEKLEVSSFSAGVNFKF